MSTDQEWTDREVPCPWVPVARYRPRWTEQRYEINLRLTQEPATEFQVLFCGDSLIRNWLSTGQKVWSEFYSQLNAFNYGISGDRTESLLFRLNSGELQGINPKVVVLMIGTNNLWKCTVPDTVRGIKTVIDTIKRLVPEAKILNLGILPRSDYRREGIKAKQVNSELAKFRIESVTYLDMTEAFENENGTIKKDLFEDGLHLTKAGYRVWAETMKPTLDELIKS